MAYETPVAAPTHAQMTAFITKRIFTTFSFNKEPHAVGNGFDLVQANGVMTNIIRFFI
jgi:hypothetical protein